MTGLLQDKVVVVAGHGPGLGASLARRCAQHGARLVLARRKADQLEAAAAQLRADGAEVLTHALDLEDHATHAGLVEATLEAYGGRFVIRGGDLAVREGGWDGTWLVVIEFPSTAQARQWYESDEYRGAAALRAGHADLDLVIVDGC